ncbi:MAG TPA: hypothetical protein VK781_08355 [Solirubrobacteraceae bacterium]|jgi:uncharacterized repeat protein (TIGR01451 family)|nr:hypothetical protein [Solirubrobacteraceae bacterium]
MYGTIRSARVVVLHATPLAIVGSATDPGAILLSFHASAGLRRGSILAQAPTRRLPAGLFDRVIGVRRTHRGVLLSLKPALLSDAFPAIDVHTTVPFNFGPPPAKSARTADFLSNVDLSYSVPLIRNRLEASCGASPTGWSLAPFGTLHPTLTANVHRGFLGLVYGELSVTLAGNIGFDATIPSGAHCGLTVDGPKGEAFIPIGDVPVPVEGSVNLNVTLALAGPAHVHAAAGATVTAGANLHGVDATPILKTSKLSASGSVTNNGVKLTIGPEVQAGLGINDVNAHVDGSFSVAAKSSTEGCEVDLGASAGIGIDFWSLHGSYTPFEAEKPIYRCPQSSPPKLQITQTGPPGAFPGQEFEYTVNVTNTGGTTANSVDVIDSLPGEGSFDSSSPGGSPTAPVTGGTLNIQLGDLAAGQTGTAKVRWHAPSNPTNLTNSALATASNAGQAGPAVDNVSVGTTGNCNPCGAASGGIGLRSRNRGLITIGGIPPGATVTQAVLVWGILYDGEQPSNAITLDGHPITANITSNASGTLCWGDTATVGYAADITPYVSGNGTFEITNPPNGEVRVDENPYGVLPYTDGASIIVFYNGGGADNQVLSDFSYNTNTDITTGESITRSFNSIHSVGGPASLTLAGPDGQNNGGKIFTFMGAGEQVAVNPFEGSALQEGPSFPIGNLWDNEAFDVTPILPSGQQTLTFNNVHTEDCIGVGAAVLQVAQQP